MIFEPVVQFYKGFKDLNSYRIVTKTKFWRKRSTILLWPIKHKMFLRPLGRALSYFFSSKLLILFDLGWFLLGDATWIIFRDAQKDPQMHKRIRRCTKGSGDAQKDPRMHERIRLAYPPPYNRTRNKDKLLISIY